MTRVELVRALALALLRSHYEDRDGTQYRSLEESEESVHFLRDAHQAMTFIDAHNEAEKMGASPRDAIEYGLAALQEETNWWEDAPRKEWLERLGTEEP